jgi:lipoprotein NlpD
MTLNSTSRLRRFAYATSALALLAACDTALPDLDLRDRAGGFDTSPSVANLPSRPKPDNRGVISYPGYQVVVARRGDTIASIAARLDQSAATLATFNGISTDTALREGEVVALPGRVTDPSPTAGTTNTSPIDISGIATTALDRAAPVASGGLAPLTGSASGVEPIRHKVQPGETAFSISRLYNVPVSTLTNWNGLSSDLDVRDGQYLLIPQNDRPVDVTGGPLVAPGLGSVSPVPPSAAAPLPLETPQVASAPVVAPPAPKLDVAPPRTATVVAPPAPAAPAAPAPAPAASSSAQFVRPVSGSIIRDYSPGKNEGIDIAAAAGTSVKAADSGTVAAVTTDTSGTAIVVLKHAGNLLTVYTNLELLSVSKGDSVARGAILGKVKSGDPSFVHFEVRRGLESVDPNEFL